MVKDVCSTKLAHDPVPRTVFRHVTTRRLILIALADPAATTSAARNVFTKDIYRDAGRCGKINQVTQTRRLEQTIDLDAVDQGE
jgi:hypothetical protein